MSFDHLHVQDMRILMGTTQPVEGELEPRAPFFPNAKFVCQRKEVDTFRSPHPMQWAWYVPGGMDHVIEDDLVLIDGDVELGVGVALAWTPGHTDGNQSLVLNTEDGVWVSSENGVAADNWHPHLSKIPGVRKEAEFMGREVILNSNTLEDSIDQYDSMVKEKAARRPQPRRPALDERVPLERAARLEAPVAGRAELHLRRHQLRHDRQEPLVLAVVSLDATNPARLDRLVEEGRMPNLAALRAAAGWPGRCEVSRLLELMEPATFYTLAMGVPVETHGRCLPFVWDPGAMRMRRAAPPPRPRCGTGWARPASAAS